MQRPIWKGTISFGLVEIPVTLQSALESGKEVHFSLLDRRDLSRVRNRRVNEKTGDEVPWSEVVRGFEHEDGEFVVLTDDEIRDANPKASGSIEILDFVDARTIDTVYWDTPYYVVPVAKAKSRAYALLRETLARTDRVAVAKVVLRTRQRLAALVVRDDAIVLDLLRYAYEVRDPAKLPLPRGSAKALGLATRELDLARELVEGMTSDWKPARYDDEYRDAVLALARRKAKAGKAHEVAPPAKRRGAGKEVLDLMPLLRKSLRKPARVATASARTARRRPATARRRARA